MLAAGVAAGCEPHFISDADYRQTVREDLASRAYVLDASGVDLDALDLETDELEAMEFLYAYMPLGDIANQSPEYYLEHCRMTWEALGRCRGKEHSGTRTQTFCASGQSQQRVS